MEELNCETVFTLPVLGGISESVVVTWIIMAVLVLLSIILVRNLKVENPGRVQLALEAGIGWAQDFFEGIIGKEAKRYGPYLITILIYLAAANTLAPLFGFKPPTKDLNVTAGLAIMSMCLIEYSGIYKNGLKHWVKHFASPVPVVAPIMVMFFGFLYALGLAPVDRARRGPLSRHLPRNRGEWEDEKDEKDVPAGGSSAR